MPRKSRGRRAGSTASFASSSIWIRSGLASATPPVPPMTDLPPPRFISKICGVADFQSRVAALPRPLVFTNGVFDILHRGHVSYLDQAAALGAALVVGVNTDESAQRLEKGPERPLNGIDDRLAVLAALASVGLVIPFAEDTPY